MQQRAVPKTITFTTISGARFDIELYGNNVRGSELALIERYRDDLRGLLGYEPNLFSFKLTQGTNIINHGAQVDLTTLDDTITMVKDIARTRSS